MATQITIDLDDLQEAVLRHVAPDPQEWVKNAVLSRIDTGRQALAEGEVLARREAGDPPLATVDELVLAALERAGVPADELTPDAASKLGLKRALVELGRWEEIKALIDADPEASEDWLLAGTVRRRDPIFERLITADAFTDQEVRQVFRRAVQIVA